MVLALLASLLPPENACIYKMYYKHPHENWLQKGLRYADQGLKVFGTAKGLYDAGRAVYGVAAPALAML